MEINKTTKELDRDHLWHPYTQMKTALEHIPIARAQGSMLYTEEGEEILDAISSWWVNPHGHAHPYIIEKIHKQMQTMEHVLFAGFTHRPAGELVHRLCQRMPFGHQRGFFSDNGSSSIEVALKMALQYYLNQGDKRDLFLSLEGAFHGDTFGAMSVGGVGVFNANFADFFIQTKRLPVPSAHNREEIQKILDTIDFSRVAGFVYEALVQGAAGMQIQDVESMRWLLSEVQSRGVLLIADEVMVGFGHTGKFFASEHFLPIEPDIMCLAKCLTGGFVPMALTTCQEQIYQAFYHDDASKTFMHGHSYTANAVGCAAALASLDLFDKEDTLNRIAEIEIQHRQFIQQIAVDYPKMRNPRVQGVIAAIDFPLTKDEYFGDFRNKLYTFALKRGVLLRPIGHVSYILPPYCITDAELERLYIAWRETIDYGYNELL